MSKIETHIKRIFRDIPDSKRKEEIMLEINQDLNDKVADLVSQGQTEDEAIQMTIEDFGDIDDIREELVGTAQLIENKNIGLSLAFSVWGGIIITALFVFINLYYTPERIWFVYPVFAVIWWPMSMFFYWSQRKSGKSTAFPYSVAAFVLILGLLLFINFYYTPQSIWFIYPAFAAIWWPIAMYFNQLRQRNRKDDGLE